MAHNIEGEETMVREQFQCDLKMLQQKVIELGELARKLYCLLWKVFIKGM